MNNYINISEGEYDNAIYRIFSIDRLLELFELKKNTIVRPSLWDDPFENLVFKSIGKMGPKMEVTFKSRDNFYGQCWSLHRETDAMWRIYSPDKNGVKVRTTIKKLLGSLYSNVDYGIVSCWIGKVQYLTQKDIIEEFSNKHIMHPVILDPSGKGQVSTLLLKREEFAHEKEVRLIYNREGSKTDENIYQYPIDPLEFIDQIVFDPRMSGYTIAAITDFLKSRGFSKYIGKSKLYQMPKNFIINF